MSTHSSTPEGRRWLRRRGRFVLAGVVAAIAIAAVPAAWATFTDVPPSNPFYADVNALQSAGISTGCGGGNFCPTASIARQGEAAFVHRAAGRMSGDISVTDNTIVSSLTEATDTIIDSDFISIGGVAGQTQFITIEASFTIDYNSGTPPATLSYYLTDATGVATCAGATFSPFLQQDITTGQDEALHITWTLGVPSGTGRTFRLCGFAGATGDDNVGVNDVSMSLITAPFGSTGANVLETTDAKPPPRSP